MNEASRAKRACRFCQRLFDPPERAKTRATAEARTKKGRSYKPLPKEFRRNRFRYRQIVREANVAIYEQTWNGSQNPSVSWEAWGVDGFTISDKDAAFQKLQQMH
jgi:hypothetical protein